MPSTSFEPEGSSSGDGYVRVYNYELCNVLPASKTRYTTPVYKTVFLKMKPRFRNM